MDTGKIIFETNEKHINKNLSLILFVNFVITKNIKLSIIEDIVFNYSN